MNTKQAGTLGESKRVEGGGSIESLLMRAVESVADHRFAADPHQERLVKKRGDSMGIFVDGMIMLAVAFTVYVVLAIVFCIKNKKPFR